MFAWLKNALFHTHQVGEVCHNHGDTPHSHSPQTLSQSPFVTAPEVLERQEKRHARVLKWCLVLNLGLFLIQLYIGRVSYSLTVLADAADLLGDSLNYLISLWVLGASALTLRKANMFKIISMSGVSLLILGYALYKLLINAPVPIASYMYGVGFLSVLVNVSCVVLLQRYKNDNANMYSAWACSLNDIVGGVFILIVALFTTGLQSYWPDLLVGFFLVLISLYASWKIWQQTVKIKK